MDEETWKGPPPRPSFLKISGDCLEGLLSWRIGLVVLILGILYVEASTPVLRQTVSGANKVKVVRARGDLRHIADQVRCFATEQRRYPRALPELYEQPIDATDWPEGGYLERLPEDPWGGDYILVLPAGNPEAFYVLSLGADNAPGGEGWDADLRHPENRP